MNKSDMTYQEGLYSHIRGRQIFFLSNRRRHTRYWRDWSSDVCSSDLTEIVDDVNADDRYLACFVSTRSEIVVPISYEGRVVGEIDIDSDTPAAFRDADRDFLERVATLIAPYCLVAWDTGGVAWAEAP